MLPVCSSFFFQNAAGGLRDWHRVLVKLWRRKNPEGGRWLQQRAQGAHARVGAAPSTGTTKGKLLHSCLNQELTNFSISVYITWRVVLFGLFFNCCSGMQRNNLFSGFGESTSVQEPQSPRQSTHWRPFPIELLCWGLEQENIYTPG